MGRKRSPCFIQASHSLPPRSHCSLPPSPPPLSWQYGTAGDQVPFTSFVGLADFPALDVFLFDPRQPSGQKYRKLARTMIPRLYHSAALLTADGTVLVVG